MSSFGVLRDFFWTGALPRLIAERADVLAANSAPDNRLPAYYIHIDNSARNGLQVCALVGPAEAWQSGDRRSPWRHAEAVEFATLERVDWFNHRRLLEPIGEVPPVEFERAYYRRNEPHAMVA